MRIILFTAFAFAGLLGSVGSRVHSAAGRYGEDPATARATLKDAAGSRVGDVSLQQTPTVFF